VFSLKVLGGAILERRGVQVKGRATHRRRLALLALLSVARRPVGRERLIGYLWPEHPTDGARRLLSESLYSLRQEMGDDALVSAGNDVTLNPRVVSSDVAEMETALEAGELERAVALYRGPLLDGFYVDDAPDFQRWAEGERDRLSRAYARALETLAERSESGGALVEAVEWWRCLLRHDQSNTRVAIRLVTALDEAGEWAGALRAADAHADYLREELGVGPPEEFTSIVDRIRADCVPAAARPTIVPGPPPAGAREEPDPVMANEGTAVVGRVDGDSGAPAEAVEIAAAAGADRSPASDDADRSRLSVDADRSPSPVDVDRSASPEIEPAGAVRAGPATDAPHPPSPAVAVPAAVPAPAPKPARRRRLGGRWAQELAYYGGLVGMVAGLALAVLSTPAARRARVHDYDPRRIAVLYLDDNTPAGELDYLANGLTEGLIERLSQVEALTVISRNGVLPYRAGSVPFDSLVNGLEVGSVVEGSVQRSGDRLRVTVRLIDANTAEHLESRTVERPMGELFALEDQLADEVAGFLRRRVGAEVKLRERAAGTRSVAARELVLRAEQERAEAERLAGQASPLGAAAALRRLRAADSLLARAARTDPRWAEPWVLRGWVSLRAARLDPGPGTPAGFREAMAHAQRALALRPASPAALELRGTARWRLARRDALPAADQDTLVRGAGRDLREALAADQSLAAAWSTLSQYLRQHGDLVEADAAARRALEEDAYLDDAEMILERLYRSSFTLARYDSAGAWCERGARQFPHSWRFLDCRLTLMGVEGGGPPDPAAAWRLVEELDQMDPPARAATAGRAYFPLYRRMAAARVLARAGRGDSARAVMGRVQQAAGSDPELAVPLLYDRACVHLLLGERTLALLALEEYLHSKPRLRDYLAADVQMRTLRDHPRFRVLVTPGRSSAGRSSAGRRGAG